MLFGYPDYEINKTVSTVIVSAAIAAQSKCGIHTTEKVNEF
jgi:hypothetical protein